MIDLTSHTRFAVATTDMMRACTLALNQTINATTRQGLWFWSELLRSSAERATAGPARTPLAGAEPYWGAAAAFGNPWSVWASSGWPGSYRDGWAGAPFAGPWASATLLSWQRLARCAAWSPAYWPAWQIELSQTLLAVPTPSADGAAHTFSSYRSAGGHAVAQIAAPAA